MTSQPTFSRQLVIAALLLILGGVVGYRFGRNDQVPGVTPLLNRVTQIRQQGQSQPEGYRDVEFAQFWEVWEILEKSYLEPERLSDEKMVYGAIQGMTSSLEDPYTMFLPPQEQQRSEEDLQGSFFGVGIQLGYVDEILAVTAPLKGSPAEKAGVQPKDLILRVKDSKVDKETTGWSLEEAVNAIRGERGTPVTLTLLRKSISQEPFEVVLIRDEIVVPSAELVLHDLPNGKKAAHITLSRFGDRTDAELDEIISTIQSQSSSIAGIILDMRNNPGGYLDGAVTVASEFIDGGLIVTQQGRGSTQKYTARGRARLAEFPVEVVVNGGSASASEIVAGALRDRRGAQLIGEKTFGKGTVQDALKLDSGAGLHVTVAKWILPGGDWIQETGIPVDVEAKDNPETEVDEVIEAAKKLL